jgi:hypothetical protein
MESSEKLSTGFCPYCRVRIGPGQSVCPSCAVQFKGTAIEVQGLNAKEVEDVAKALHSQVSTATKKSSAPGFLDSIIIILVSGAIVIFLLWATSRTLGINAFEHLPDYLEKAYNAVWTSVVAGTAGIGLAIVNTFTKKPDDPRPNFLLLIGITTITMLLLIFFMPRLFAQQLNGHHDVEAHLVSGGFDKPIMGPQLHGTQCGQTTIEFPAQEVEARVNEFTDFRWNAAYICRNQGIAGPATGRVDWNTPNGDYSTLPGAAPAYGEWGTMRFKYFRPNRYRVTMDVNASCIDVGMAPNPCTARGQFDVNVLPAN